VGLQLWSGGPIQHSQRASVCRTPAARAASEVSAYQLEQLWFCPSSASNRQERCVPPSTPSAQHYSNSLQIRLYHTVYRRRACEPLCAQTCAFAITARDGCCACKRELVRKRRRGHLAWLDAARTRPHCARLYTGQGVQRWLHPGCKAGQPGSANCILCAAAQRASG